VKRLPLKSECLDFLRSIRPRIASTTYTRKFWQIRTFCRWLKKENMPYVKVKRQDVERFLLSLTGSRPFRQSMCGVVREFYDFLKIRHPRPLKNPASGIEFTRDTSRRLPKAPSQAAVDEIFVRLYEQDGDLCIRDRLMAELAYGSGLRRSELARLNVEDIDLENATAWVLGKGNQPRLVPLTARTLEAMRELISKGKASCGPLLVSLSGCRLGVAGIYNGCSTITELVIAL
jgi:site-specific recombinase XerC